MQSSNVDVDVFSKIGRVAVTWEKLRLLYNLILAGVSVLAVLIGPFVGVMDEEFGFDVMLGVAVANAAYCLGPLIDGYMTWFGLRTNVVTAFLFISGALIAASLAFFSIAFWGMPDK